TVGIAWLFNKLTLGLAGLVLNSIILLWVSRMMPEKIKVPNFLSAFIGAALLSAANALVF
ncbi:MAG TPA: phage holin family protein, partial [Leptospiraceae bacterium]|nr:phage holin family protein [Leptospiraceae bacterium]